MREKEAMPDITLTPEQLETAPPAVRRWIESLAAAGAGAVGGSGDANLAVCGIAEAMEIFGLIRHDALACAAFLELGSGSADAQGVSDLDAIELAAISRGAGIAERGALLAGLNLANGALQSLRGDPMAMLFAIDDANRCRIARATRRAIHLLWRDVRETPRETLARLPSGEPDGPAGRQAHAVRTSSWPPSSCRA